MGRARVAAQHYRFLKAPPIIGSGILHKLPAVLSSADKLALASNANADLQDSLNIETDKILRTARWRFCTKSGIVPYDEYISHYTQNARMYWNADYSTHIHTLYQHYLDQTAYNIDGLRQAAENTRNLRIEEAYQLTAFDSVFKPLLLPFLSLAQHWQIWRAQSDFALTQARIDQQSLVKNPKDWLEEEQQRQPYLRSKPAFEAQRPIALEQLKSVPGVTRAAYEKTVDSAFKKSSYFQQAQAQIKQLVEKVEIRQKLNGYIAATCNALIEKIYGRQIAISTNWNDQPVPQEKCMDEPKVHISLSTR